LDELLKEVLEQPESDGPRLVYADWLSERGDPRGEFIAVQCELARKFELPLVAREQQLLREHGAKWSAELGLPPRPRSMPGEIPQVVFRRGFAERVEVEVGELARIDIRRMPVRHVVVAGVRDGNIGELVALPAIKGVASVGIRNAHLKPRNVRRLGEAPLVVGAEALAFHHGHLSDVSELAAMELPALRSLHLDDAYMQNIHVLARAIWLPQLRALRIRDTHRFALRHLVGARGLAGLVELRIETNMLVSELVELASATHFDQLAHLEVAIGYSDDSAVAAFARAKGFEKLERFVVRGKLSDELVARLRSRWGDALEISR
jgi:uncharacterized protein (TIGR02996 family)